MGSAPGQLKLVKAGFVVLDQTAAVQKIIAFQYNPETLVRRLDASAATTSPLASARAAWTCPPV